MDLVQHLAPECGGARFAGFELRLDRRELRYGDRQLVLRNRPFDVLVYLLRHRDRVVPRQELLRHVWSGVCVSDAALSSAIRDLRKALSVGGPASSVIQTRHGFGYRFVAPVEEEAAAWPARTDEEVPARWRPAAASPARPALAAPQAERDGDCGPTTERDDAPGRTMERDGAPSRAWLEAFLHRLSAFLSQELAARNGGGGSPLSVELSAWVDRERAGAAPPRH